MELKNSTLKWLYITPIAINSKELFLLTLFKCPEPPNKKGASVSLTLKGKVHLRD